MNRLAEICNAGGELWWPHVWHLTWQSTLVAVLLIAAAWKFRTWPSPLRYGLVLLALAKFAVPPMLAAPTGAFSWLSVVNPPLAAAAAVPEQLTAQAGNSPLPSMAMPAPGKNGLEGIAIDLSGQPVDRAALSNGEGAEGAAGRPLSAERNAAAGAAFDGHGAAAPLAWRQLGWKARLMLIHAVGAGAICLLVLWQMAKLMRLSRHAAPLSTGPIAELFGSLCRQMGLGRRVRLLISREPVAPMTFGTLRPAVMLSSQAVEELSHDEIATILAHELAHHSRFDPWVNWLQAAVAVVWWFNPVVWLLNRAIHRVREDCCDDLILQRGLTNGRLYGQTLLHVAERLAVRISPGLAWPAQRMHPLTARMARVMDSRLRRTSRMSLSGALLVALLGLVLLPGVSAEPQQASAEAKKQPSTEKTAADTQQSPKPSEPRSATEEETAKQPLTISAFGNVIDEHATPVAGARVYLRESATFRVSENPYDDRPQDVLAEVKTNEQGEFRFERVPYRPFARDWGGWDVVVVADGYSLGWQHLRAPGQRTEVKLVLVPEATISGRMVDEKGRPADNVQVQIVGIAPLGSPPRESNTEPDRLDLGFSKLAPTVRTGSNGRFAFRGLPPGKRIALSMDDKRFVREGFYSATTPAQQPDLIDVSYSKGERRERSRPVHTGDFTVVLIAGPTLQVHVILADTGKPLSAAKLVLSWESYGQHAVSDGEGRFSFYGMRADEFNVWARAPEDTDYLSRTTHVRFSPDKMHQEIELSLPQGEIVTGIAVDKKTGRGVPKVQVIHQAESPEGTTDDAARPELAAQPATTDADGSFRLAVPPGKAVIHLMGPVDGYDVPDRVQQRQDPRGGYRQTVDVVPGQALDGLRFELGRGLVIEGIVLDPEGLPVGGARVTWRDPSYRRRQQRTSTDQEGRFSLGGLPAASQPELIVTHADRKLMGTVQVAGAEEAEEATGTGVTREVSIEVKLEQAASITGQALLGDKPYPGVRIYLMVERADLAGRGRGLASTGEGAVTDEEGRYRLEPVQAGQKLFVSANIGTERPKGGIVNIKLEPGEERELPPFEFLVLDASVSGVVVDPDGNPVAGVTVSASEQGGGSIAGGFTRQPTGPDGRFTIPRLPSAPLQLMAYIRLPDDATDRRIRFPAIVRIQPGQTDVRIVLDPKLQRAGQR